MAEQRTECHPKNCKLEPQYRQSRMRHYQRQSVVWKRSCSRNLPQLGPHRSRLAKMEAHIPSTTHDQTRAETTVHYKHNTAIWPPRPLFLAIKIARPFHPIVLLQSPWISINVLYPQRRTNPKQ
jgi:hypothetical protein